MYSFEEQTDMLLIYGECQRNSVRASDLYAERYPQRSHPTRRTFKYLYDKLRTTGSLAHQKKSRLKKATNEATEIGILATVVRDPCVSSRQIAREAGVSQKSVLRVLHRYKYHPYHISLHQELSGTDFMNRVEFCRWAQLQIQRNNSFINWTLFTDEATFTNHGNINLHNMHYWSTENPRWLRQLAHQRPWSVNVWCGIIEDRIIGPYFIEGHLNGRKYTTFLQETLGPLLEELPLETRNKMWYQHDGCPAHFSLMARNELQRRFPNRWIGRGGTVSWPARSPDLTPLDFGLWGLLKDIVYKEAPTTPEDMQQRIVTACNSINAEVIRNTTQSVIRRLQHCIDNNGNHFEHLL